MTSIRYPALWPQPTRHRASSPYRRRRFCNHCSSFPSSGRLFVTPVVALIHQIPIVGDILHPFIGYPVQFGLPGGTPMPRDVKVISFDGTRSTSISCRRTDWRRDDGADDPERSGLGPSRRDEPRRALLDDIFLPQRGRSGSATLREAGYNVVTWDPRGEWSSGGRLRDRLAGLRGPRRLRHHQLAGHAARGPARRRRTDPRIGMVGASYGGGIQLVTAAIDQRVDAIVPTIAWNSLNTSLYKSEAFKSSWGTLLTAALMLTGARVESADLSGGDLRRPDRHADAGRPGPAGRPRPCDLLTTSPRRHC